MFLVRTRKRSAPRSIAFAALSLATLSLLVGCSDDQALDDDVSDQAGGTSALAGKPDGDSSRPWPAPTDVPERVAAAGQLQVIVDGAEVPVPANIGVDPATGAMSALHTHTEDGQIHIEADVTGEVFTLGQLFTQWGVQLSRGQIGGVRAKTGETVTVTTNGKPYSGDPTELRLQPNQQIVVQLK